ncbi:hypothetical protein CMV_026975 [Castanea mollissima]|uniref:NAD-dependent epimerase/dehydratase domain-containing protein n=1 Tax=Castanea mollissima TaxID=60419 RepID=A0A8J4VFE6_9ROSI|nr:hypothetical protein CMV_026975 [Castanea mollissima]
MSPQETLGNCLLPQQTSQCKISCSTKIVASHIWLLYLPCDDWFATAWSGEFNQIEVVFESTRPGLYVQKCGLSLIYKQDVEMFTQTKCSRNRITFEGCDGSCDGSHDEFDNLWRNCDDYDDNETRAICSSSKEIESYISSVNDVRSCYDEGKRTAETLTMDYHRGAGVEVRIAKIFNTYGPRMCIDDGRVVSNFVAQALRKEPMTVYGDGKQTRSFQYVSDLFKN